MDCCSYYETISRIKQAGPLGQPPIPSFTPPIAANVEVRATIRLHIYRFLNPREVGIANKTSITEPHSSNTPCTPSAFNTSVAASFNS
jgi:hypothetical protein